MEEKDYISRKETFYLFVMLFLCFVLGFLSSRLLTYSNVNIALPTFNKEIISENRCSGMKLLETANCLQTELKEFYIYNMSNLREKYDVEKLKAGGGVCWHFAQWYSDRAKETGYYSKEVTVDIGDIVHVFTVISNEEGYCIMDQTSLSKCQLLKNGGEI